MRAILNALLYVFHEKIFSYKDTKVNLLKYAVCFP